MKRINNGEIISKVHDSMYHQIKATGMAVPMQVLIDLGVLSKQDCEKWRFGKVDYLERVCKVNLSKLSSIMKEIRQYAGKNNLKESWSFYRQWGVKDKRVKIKLRFSKHNTESVERLYATHYINSERISELKSVNNGSEHSERNGT